MKIRNQEISSKLLKEKEVQLFIKRIDLIHKYVSGNKWYKLKYNLSKAKEQGYKIILTFGGAYSNHIAATSYLAKKEGFKAVGLIRGEECLPLNSTLSFAQKNKMKLYYLHREDYKLKHTKGFLDNLKVKFGDFYLLPEGGTNKLAVQGTSEILEVNDTQDYICCAVGTGGTLAGVVNSTNNCQKVIGFSAIKGFLELDVNLQNLVNKNNYRLIDDYSCGGYAKLTDQLINTIYYFHRIQNISLDAVYTGKMMMGILDLVAKDYFPKGSSILAIHSGGLQGNKGMNNRFKLKLPVR